MLIKKLLYIYRIFHIVMVNVDIIELLNLLFSRGVCKVCSQKFYNYNNLS